jgi:hypothetical protein
MQVHWVHIYLTFFFFDGKDRGRSPQRENFLYKLKRGVGTYNTKLTEKHLTRNKKYNLRSSLNLTLILKITKPNGSTWKDFVIP